MVEILVFLGSILTITLRAGTSLIYGTIGEIYTERTGILNLGVEGMMLCSAVVAFAVAYYSENLWLALLAAGLTGGTLALIHAFLTVTMRANQVVSGLSITLFGTGLASFLGERLGPESNNRSLVGLIGPRFHPLELPGMSSIPRVALWPLFLRVVAMPVSLCVKVPAVAFTSAR